MKVQLQKKKGNVISIADNLMNRANELLNECQYYNAVELLSKALQIDCNNSEVYMLLGTAKLLMDNPAAAIIDFDKAIELDNFFEIAYHNRGMAYATLDQFDKCVADLEKAKDLGEFADEDYCDLACAYVKTGNLSKAVENFTKAFELAEHNANYLYCRAVTYFNLNSYNNAIKDFLLLFSKYRNNDLNPLAYFYLAQSYQLKGIKENKRILLKKAIKSYKIFLDNDNGENTDEIENAMNNLKALRIIIKKY